MKLIKKIFEFYVYSNLHVSIAIWSLSMITGSYFGVEARSASLFIGISTFVSYNGIRFFKYKTALLKKEMHVWFSKNSILLVILNSLLIIQLIQFVIKLSAIELKILFPFIVFTLLYMLPFMKFNGQRYSLRKIPGFKIFCIGISWAGLITFFPLVNHFELKGTGISLFFMQQFLFIVVLILPFDIRDMDFDAEDLKTIPMVLGVKWSKRIAMILLLIVNVVSVCVFEDKEVVVLFLMSLLLGGFVWCSKRNQSKYYASFWVEGIPIIWLVLLFLIDFLI
ncbi:hypothetical protein [Flavicella sp.]|uniref:hypothetical protein n=1 Tax=Flavicella sp. TaxID=2957742 RepID=UPI00301588C4